MAVKCFHAIDIHMSVSPLGVKITHAAYTNYQFMNSRTCIGLVSPWRSILTRYEVLQYYYTFFVFAHLEATRCSRNCFQSKGENSEECRVLRVAPLNPPITFLGILAKVVVCNGMQQKVLGLRGSIMVGQFVAVALGMERSGSSIAGIVRYSPVTFICCEELKLFRNIARIWGCMLIMKQTRTMTRNPLGTDVQLLNSSNGRIAEISDVFETNEV